MTAHIPHACSATADHDNTSAVVPAIAGFAGAA